MRFVVGVGVVVVVVVVVVVSRNVFERELHMQTGLFHTHTFINRLVETKNQTHTLNRENGKKYSLGIGILK